MARITYKYIKSVEATELSRLTKQQAEDYLRKFREKYRFREKAFQREPHVYSPALEKMQDYYDRNKVQPPEEMSLNKIRAELFQIQDFFKAKTSDVKGARQVMREQDERIFGLNEKGKPARRMTLDERTEFWSLYHEFLKTYKNAEAIYGSDKIQQYLGDLTILGRKNADLDIGRRIEVLRKTLRDSEVINNAEVRNVRQGL